MATLSKMSSTIPQARDQGIPFFAGANQAGVSVQGAQVTQVGATPFATTFAAMGLKDMADTSYVVMIGGDKQAVASVTQVSKTTTGFSIVGGAAADVHDVMVVGRMAGQVKKNGTR
jgi:hypothetical protein